MKSFFKFTLLTGLIIGGKLAKQSAQTTVAQTVTNKPAATNNSSILFVHQVLTSEPVQPVQGQNQPQQSGSGLIAEMF